ncbi:MAG TPA: hypothetical protein H9900_02320 [Candidatus Monoglobus merdigallinarum]|uniref:Uncharacterized protein n=1 Tax=Candidatus Monoglobus merdigallinarum TaxID=2838698 RepID=A0A9D1PPP6_9FIRM|nr:hypothetical protein [Candidatus Monoglobus merdigallinarum]
MPTEAINKLTAAEEAAESEEREAHTRAAEIINDANALAEDIIAGAEKRAAQIISDAEKKIEIMNADSEAEAERGLSEKVRALRDGIKKTDRDILDIIVDTLEK